FARRSTTPVKIVLAIAILLPLDLLGIALVVLPLTLGDLVRRDPRVLVVDALRILLRRLQCRAAADLNAAGVLDARREQHGDSVIQPKDVFRVEIAEDD